MAEIIYRTLSFYEFLIKNFNSKWVRRHRLESDTLRIRLYCVALCHTEKIDACTKEEKLFRLFNFTSRWWWQQSKFYSALSSSSLMMCLESLQYNPFLLLAQQHVRHISVKLKFLHGKEVNLMSLTCRSTISRGAEEKWWRIFKWKALNFFYYS